MASPAACNAASVLLLTWYCSGASLLAALAIVECVTGGYAPSAPYAHKLSLDAPLRLVYLSCSDLERQLQQKDQLIQDAERRVADKQRAYNLLYADFAKQKAEAAEAVEAASQLQHK